MGKSWEYLKNIGISDKTNRIHHGYSIGIIMGISSKIEDSRGTFLIQMEIGANGPLVQPADPKDQPIGR